MILYIHRNLGITLTASARSTDRKIKVKVVSTRLIKQTLTALIPFWASSDSVSSLEGESESAPSMLNVSEVWQDLSESVHL